MNKEIIQRILSSIVIIPIALFFIIKGSFYFNYFLTACFFISLYEWYILSKEKKYLFAGTFFLIISFISVYLLRSGNDQSNTVFFCVLIISISTDLGGYIFGKIFKGPKLTKISPNKTYAGMFGGLLLSIISVVVLFYYQNNFNNFISLVNIDFTMTLFLLIILTSLISQIGDLIISYFKRLSNIKNTGRLIPGHGGLLDRIDGMIFAFPFSYLLYWIFV